MKRYYFRLGPLFYGPLVIEATCWRKARKLAVAWWEKNGAGQCPNWRKP